MAQLGGILDDHEDDPVTSSMMTSSVTSQNQNNINAYNEMPNGISMNKEQGEVDRDSYRLFRGC